MAAKPADSTTCSFTLGDLIEILQGSEDAFTANSRTADRMETQEGSISAAWWRAQASALKFSPDPVTMPGVDRIQLLCDELGNGGGLTATNVIRVRANVCRAKPCTLAEANALTLGEAADVLEEALRLAAKGQIGTPETPMAPTVAPPRAKKRSTTRGEAGAKLIAALTAHHKYGDGGCLNLEPVGNNELARMAGVAQRTASAFFAKEFKGHENYRASCRDSVKLVSALKLLNGEFSPHVLFGSTPPGSTDRDDDD